MKTKTDRIKQKISNRRKKGASYVSIFQSYVAELNLPFEIYCEITEVAKYIIRNVNREGLKSGAGYKKEVMGECLHIWETIRITLEFKVNSGACIELEYNDFLGRVTEKMPKQKFEMICSVCGEKNEQTDKV